MAYARARLCSSANVSLGAPLRARLLWLQRQVVNRARGCGSRRKGLNISKVLGFIVGGIVVGCVAFVVVLLLIKAMWAWTVPDLFPGAVEQGLVAGSVSWFTAVKLALFLAILSGIAGGHKAHKHE